ncbi:MAG TPA: hypothetical protein VMC84_04030 [Methanocella sp.]|nr:hypothetical protein [Methanocella sp.]HTY90323.1 hypothetical protein [Methanocella sp.]
MHPQFKLVPGHTQRILTLGNDSRTGIFLLKPEFIFQNSNTIF